MLLSLRCCSCCCLGHSDVEAAAEVVGVVQVADAVVLGAVVDNVGVVQVAVAAVADDDGVVQVAVTAVVGGVVAVAAVSAALILKLLRKFLGLFKLLLLLFLALLKLLLLLFLALFKLLLLLLLVLLLLLLSQSL